MAGAMPLSLFREWQAYWELEPFGPIQEDLRAAWPTYLIYEANRGKEAPRRRPDYFFPSLRQGESEGQTPEQLALQAEILMAAWGGVKSG